MRGMIRPLGRHFAVGARALPAPLAAARAARLTLGALAALVLVAGCRVRHASEGHADIALYADRGAEEHCVGATESMFEWMGCRVTRVKALFINNEPLDEFRILCFPGGNMYEYAQDLSSEGKEKIRDFVRDGGGYIGICGGSYFAAERVFWQGEQLPMEPLALYPGISRGPIDEIAPAPERVMAEIYFDIHHPVTWGEPDTAWILYWMGPALLPDEGAEVDVLGRYDIGGDPAVLAFEYGEGRVFLIGAHPEFEEDSERDGYPASEEFRDRGSDWDLMKRAARWCEGLDE
jgi:glutamine amidotransferase-like uncharacterized protein